MANKLQKKKTTVQKIVKKQKPVVAVEKAAHATKEHIALPQGEYVVAVGRRKTAIARVRIYKTTGDFVVNGKLVGEYFRGIHQASAFYNAPFTATETLGQYATAVKVEGSGSRAQLGAVSHGIARALLKLDPNFRLVLKQKGLLTRDDRMKETRSIGTGGKARRTKQSPKR